jgi:hypothetical protein
VIVLNAATSKGNMAALVSQLRLWRIPVSANPAQELLHKDDTTPN